MKKIFLVALLLLITSLQVNAWTSSGGKKFECSSNSYLFSSAQTASETGVFNIGMKDAKVTFIKTFADSHINATGYNPKDNYIYGWEYGEGSNYSTYDRHLVKIDVDFNVQRVELIGTLPNERFYLGDVDKNGIYYLANRYSPSNWRINGDSYLVEIHRVDLNTNTVLSKLTLDYPINAIKILASDFAINPIDNQLYTVNANNNKLVRIDVSTGKVKELGYVGNIGNTYSVINFFDKSGNFYFYTSGSEKIYKIDISNPSVINSTATPFTNKLRGMVNSGDGARCANAAMDEEASLIAEYHFDACTWDGTAGEVIDSSGHGFHGKALNSARSDIDNGQINGSGKFTDVNDAVKVEGITGLDSNNFSVSFWTKIDKNNGTHKLLKLGNKNAHNTKNGDWGIVEVRYRESDNELRIVGDRKEGETEVDGYSAIVNTKLHDGAWHHIVITSKETKIKLYVDTVDPDMKAPVEDKSPFNPGVLDDFNGELIIGNSISGSFSTKANIDEVKLYDGALGSEEIAKIHNNEKAHKNSDGSDREAVVCLEAFDCDDTMYFSNAHDLTSNTKENGKMFLHAINREKSPFTFSKIGEGYHVGGVVENSFYNALGYNPEDDFLYATVKNRLLKIGKNGQVKDLGVIAGLRNEQHFAGTFGHVEADGTAYYYLTKMHDKKIYKIDVKTKPITIKETIVLKQEDAVFAVDMTIDETGDNLYYMQRKEQDKASPNQLMKLNIETKKVTAIGDAVDGESLVGSIFCDTTGRVFVLYDEGGFYEIDTTTGERKAISSAPLMAYLNDGAMCPGATVKFDKPILTIGDASVNEGGSLVFPISLENNTNPKSFVFSYQAFDGNDQNDKVNATIGDDFTADTFSHTVVQELAKDTTVTIPTVDDALVESDEGMRLVFSDISGVLYHDSMLAAKGTIKDNDKPNKGTCYATTDNYNKLFIYDDLNETDGLASPRSLNLVDIKGEAVTLDGEGGSFRAKDGYMYVFAYSKTVDGMDLKKVDVTTGLVTMVKEGLLPHHSDSAEFYYVETTKTDVMYATDKSKEEFYTIDTTTWTKTVKDIVGSEGQEVKIGALAIDPYSGKIYAMQDFGGITGKESENPILFTLDITGTNVVATKVFTLPRVDAEGLAFANDGKLYLETEEEGSGDDEYKIYRLNLDTQTLTKVAHTGTKDLRPTDTSENDYVDIETLSCDGGVYQAPARFFIEDKHISIKEGNTNNAQGTNGVDINITIKANRAIRSTDYTSTVGGIEFKINTRAKSAKVNQDFISPNPSSIVMPEGSSVAHFKQALVKADRVEEVNEVFECYATLVEADNKASFKDGENSLEVTILDDDIDTFDAWNKVDGNLTTQVVNRAFTLNVGLKDSLGRPAIASDTNVSMRIVEPLAGEACKLTNHSLTGWMAFDYTSFGQNSPSIMIDKASKKARVQFFWTNVKGEAVSACSSDSFSIRPSHYVIETTPSGVIKAGEEFNITLKALDGSNAPTTGYSESVDVYRLDINESKPQCQKGTLVASKVAFVDGIAEIYNATYSEVGEITFHIEEVVGDSEVAHEYAFVDRGDTLSESERLVGAYTSSPRTFEASSIELEATLESDASGNFVFYAGNKDDSTQDETKDMAAKITAVVTAKSASGIAQNFSKECYAKDVTMMASYDISGESHLEPVIQYDDKNSSTVDAYIPTSGLVTATNNSFAYTLKKELFESGRGEQMMRVNFHRAKDTALNPAKMSVTTVSAGLDSSRFVEKYDLGEETFIYLRAHVPSPQTNVGAERNITVGYELYMDDGVDRGAFGFTDYKESEDEVNWYKIDASLSNQLDFDTHLKAMYGSFTNADYDPATPSAVSLILQHKNATSIYVRVPKLPYRNRVLYSPSKHYLMYNRHNPNVTEHSFGLNFISDKARWSGKGNLGSTVDTKVSAGNGLQKLNW